MPTKFKAGFQDFDPAAIASNLPEPLQWTGGALLGGLKSALGLIGGETPEQSAGASLGGPMMAAEGELTPIARKAGDALSGLYSRVSRVASKLPESIHPNKLSSVLKNQANPEEVEFRNLGKFLKGNEMVKKGDLLSHLEANPEPEVNLTTKHFGPSDPNNLEEFIRSPRESEPKYHSYQLPGGENYKENLITQPSKMVPSGEFEHHSMEAYDPTKGAKKAKYLEDYMHDSADDLEDMELRRFLDNDDGIIPEGPHINEPNTPTEDELYEQYQNARYGRNRYSTKPTGPDTEPEAEGIYRHHNSFGGPKYGETYADKFGFNPVYTTETMKPVEYQSPHWDEPNVLVHSRTQDRPLNPTSQWSSEHFQYVTPDEAHPLFGLDTREHMFRRLSDNQLISGFGDTPEEALQDVVQAHGKPWMGGDTPPQVGPKIRNIENIQSDWHQAGNKYGYDGDPALAAHQARVDQLDELRDPHYDQLHDLRNEMEQKYGANWELPPINITDEELDDIARRHFNTQHYGWLSQADRNAVDQAVMGGRNPGNTNFYDASKEFAERSTPIYNQLAPLDEEYERLTNLLEQNEQRVPDAPFKDKGWLDLALKHQLLDVANDPSIEGISFTPGEELMRRGEGQSPKFNNEIMPNALKRLLKPFGGGEPTTISLGKAEPNNVRFVSPHNSISPSPYGLLHAPEIGEQGTDVLSGLMNEGLGGDFYRPSRGHEINAHQLINYYNKYSIRPGYKSPYFQITPAMKEQLKKQGLPLLSIMGLAAAQPNQGEQ